MCSCVFLCVVCVSVLVCVACDFLFACLYLLCVSGVCVCVFVPVFVMSA